MTNIKHNMEISIAQIYFIIVFSTNIYAYYLFDQMADTYGKSEDRCGGLTKLGFKAGTMLLNTIMFVCNLFFSGKIIKSICAIREYRKNKTITERQIIPDDEVFMFLAIAGSGIPLIPLINSLIGRTCLYNKFTSLYYHYVLMMCMLTIVWVLNICMMGICCHVHDSLSEQTNTNTNTTSRDPNPYDKCEYLIFKCSDKYKKINTKHKTFFALGVGILHLVSVYIFNGVNAYDVNTQNYINTIFWIGHLVDTLNLIVLFYDDYADITMVGLTFCSLVNALIVGIILSLTVDLSYHIAVSLILSNIFIGLYMGYIVFMILLCGCVGMFGFLSCVIVLVVPLTLWAIAFIFIMAGRGLGYLLGCDNEDICYDLTVECCQLCKPYVDFADRIVKKCEAFLDYVFGIESVPETNNSYQNVNVPVPISVSEPMSAPMPMPMPIAMTEIVSKTTTVTDIVTATDIIMKNKSGMGNNLIDENV